MFSHKPSGSKGFTLIELMIVVAVLSVIALMAVPRFRDMTARARESSARSRLGAVRGALSIYYSDNQFHPAQLAALEQSSRYLKELPELVVPAIDGNPGHSYAGEALALDDGSTGAWYYSSGTGTAEAYINCTHHDSRGRLWTEY